MNKNTTHLRWLLTTLMLVAAMAMPSVASAAITPSKLSIGDIYGDADPVAPYCHIQV